MAARAEIELSREVRNSLGHQKLNNLFLSSNLAKQTLEPIADIVIQMMEKWTNKTASMQR